MLDIFKVGDRVVITSNKSKYKGTHCTVGKIYYSQLGLYPDGAEDIYHPRENEWENDKCLRILKTSVKKINENMEENKMTKLTGFNKVAVIGIGATEYYYALYDENVTKHDKVFVTGKSIGNLLIVKDVITTEEAVNKLNKNILDEVICKVDTTDYDNRVEKRKQAEKIKKQMDEEIRKMQETNKYEMYAEKNPALAELLNTYKSLVC